MILYLTRHGSIPGIGTFGTLKAGDLILKTVEREWLDNKAGLSCVPEGVYELDPHASNKKWIGNTWALVNHDLGVYHWPNTNAKRYAILIHVANHQGQLEGCIGVGSKYGMVSAYEAATLGVWNSMDSMKRLRSALKGGDHYLDIRSA